MKRHVKGMERAPYGPKTNGNLIRCHLQGFGKTLGGFDKKVVLGAENRAQLTEMARNRRFLRSHKIQNRLARRPTLVVLCLKQWSLRGGGIVRVMKCVILFSGMVDSNSRLKGNETTRKMHGTCNLWPKNQCKPHKMSSTRIW
jgi:hypothetical protein